MSKRIANTSWEEEQAKHNIEAKIENKKQAKQQRLIQKQIRKETRELKLRERAKKEQSFFINPRMTYTTIICALLLIPSIFLYHTDSYFELSILLIFSALIIAGESLDIPLVRHKSLSLGIVVIPALARTQTENGVFSLRDTLLVIAGATLCSSFLIRNSNIKSRILFFANRAITYMTGLFVYRFVIESLDTNNTNLYIAVLLSAASMLAVGEILNLLSEYFYTTDNYYSFQVIAGLISIFAGTTLLAIGFGGTISSSETNALGINAFWICTIPTLVARFSFARYFRIVKNYRETIRALSSAPELGGIVPTGHASRVAHLSVAMARHLKLDEHEVEALETAAYLHTIGDAVLDVNFGPDIITEEEAAQVTAKIVRRTGGLGRIAEIIENHSVPYRGVVNGSVVAQNDLTASILRLANDYEVLSRAEDSLGRAALKVLYTESNQYTYHPKVVEALEVILDDPRYGYMVDPLAFSFAEAELAAVSV